MYLKGQHDTHTHTPKTLVNLEIVCTRNQLEIKKAAEHRQELQKQMENTRKKLEAQTEIQKQQTQGGAREARAPLGRRRRRRLVVFIISVCASSFFLVFSICFCSSWRCSAAFLISS